MTSHDEASSALATMTLGGHKQKGSFRRGDNEKNKKLTCHYCKKVGHIAKYCFSKKKVRENKYRDNKKPDDKKDSSNLNAFVLTNEPNILLTNNEKNIFLELNDKEVWLLDSAASQHVSCRRD